MKPVDFTDQEMAAQAAYISNWKPTPKFTCPCGGQTPVWRLAAPGGALLLVCAGCGNEVVTIITTCGKETTTIVTTKHKVA